MRAALTILCDLLDVGAARLDEGGEVPRDWAITVLTVHVVSSQ